MTISLPDLLGHAAYLSLFGGQFLIAHGKRAGWLFRLGGEALWLGIGAHLGLSSIVIWSALFMALELYGWRKARG